MKLIVSILALVMILSIPVQAQSVFSYGVPSGDFRVGFSQRDLQTEVLDELTADAGDRRRLALEIWYPAGTDDGEPIKSFASGPVAQALEEQFPFPHRFASRVAVRAASNAKPAPGQFPVIVLSPGLSFPIALYQSHAENLASRGYIVVGVNHPHAIAATEYQDGTVIDMSQWPRIEDETARQRFLAEHAAIWERDLIGVLDWVTEGASDSAISGHVADGKVGLLGHSYGGTAAGRLTKDSRVGAAVVLEGAVRDAADPEARGQLTVGAPLLHIIGGYNRLEHEGGQYRPSSGAPVFQLVIEGTGHAEFSDLIFVYAFFADREWHARRRYGLAPDRVLQIVGDYSAAFFDRYLRGAEMSVLLRPRSYAEKVDRPAVAGYPEVDLFIEVH